MRPPSDCARRRVPKAKPRAAPKKYELDLTEQLRLAELIYTLARVIRDKFSHLLVYLTPKSALSLSVSMLNNAQKKQPFFNLRF